MRKIGQATCRCTYKHLIVYEWSFPEGMADTAKATSKLVAQK